MSAREPGPDGRFELYYQHGWVVLTVHGPAERGRPVYLEDVQNRMRVLGMPRIDPSFIRSVIANASGAPVRLAEWPAGIGLASTIGVTVAEDRMSASVEVSQPKKGAAPPTVKDVRDELEKAGVVYGIDDSIIADLLARETYGEPVVCAKGEAPVHARGRQIRYHFNPNRGKPYLEMKFGRINLKELDFVENRNAGDLLAELTDPIPPRDGRSVLGETLFAETTSEPLALLAGQDTELSPDGDKVYASADGNVKLVRGAVTIEQVVKVANVNYETGNIRFEGTVVVEKEVADGFHVEAGGDIQVGLGVGRATLKAGGNVLLKAGMNGAGSGRIECEGNLFARYIESATVHCRGHVFVDEAIMDSDVLCWGHCVLQGRRAEAMTSDLTVGGSLWCKRLGGFNEAPVHAALGVSPEILAEYNRLRRELESSQEQLARAEEQYEQVDRAIRDGRDDEKIIAARDQLHRESVRLAAAIPELRHQLGEVRGHLTASRDSVLVVEDTIFKGAAVTFGRLEYHAPDNGARKTILKPGESEIHESGFNYADAPTLRFTESPAGE